MNDDREQKIKERAYAIWEEEGRPNDRAQAHWQQAEQEMPSEMSANAGADAAWDRPSDSAADGAVDPSASMAEEVAIAASSPAPAGITPMKSSAKGKGRTA